MKYRIEYSGGAVDNTWHGFAIVEASSLPEAVRKIENQIACTPAHIDAVFPNDDAPESPATCKKCSAIGKCVAAFDDGKQAYNCECGNKWES
jgi:hypothetical protein